MNVITSPTIIITSLIVGWIVYFVIKQHYKLIIEAKDERIKSRNELLMIFGIPEQLNINIQTPKLTTPYALALSALIKDEIKQIFIALKNRGKPIPINSEFKYSLKLDSTYIKRVFNNFETIKKQFRKTQLLEYNSADNTIKLTRLGEEFVDWLIKDGQRASYFQSEVLGGWGSLPDKPKKTNLIIHCSPAQINTKDI